MRLVTIVAVSALMVSAGMVYANGSTKTTTPPSQEVTTPSGAGPTTTPATPATPSVPACETNAQPNIQPPCGAGPSTCGPVPNAPIGAISSTPEVETLNTNIVVSTYGVDPSCVVALRQSGWTWGDIYMMAQLANKTNQPITAVATWRAQGLSWNDIAARCNLTAMDITVPTAVTTKVAGYTAEYNYQPIYYLADPWGNPVLTRFDAQRFQKMGYSWSNIAVAANISAATGTPVSEVLAWGDRGYTWNQVALAYGLNPDYVMNISRYPFGPGMSCPPPSTVPVGAGPAPQQHVCGHCGTTCPPAQTTCNKCGAYVPPCGAGAGPAPAPQQHVCGHCGTSCPPAQTTCNKCGAYVPPCGAGPAPAPQQHVCGHCGTTCPPAQTTCNKCGAYVPPAGAGPAPAPQQHVCGHCGTVCPQTQNTCNKCGAYVPPAGVYVPPSGAGPANIGPGMTNPYVPNY